MTPETALSGALTAAVSDITEKTAPAFLSLKLDVNEWRQTIFLKLSKAPNGEQLIYMTPTMTRVMTG